MRQVLTATLVAALLASLPGPRTASAGVGVYDGNWSVVVITENGTCDRAYRYSVHVENGEVRYNGDARGINLAGTVSPNGQVAVSIRLRDRGADGNGHLAENTGAGRWHGSGANNACAGVWEAERR
jgi:hypothetical protein